MISKEDFLIANRNLHNVLHDGTSDIDAAYSYLNTINMDEKACIWSNFSHMSGDKDYTPNDLYKTFERVQVMARACYENFDNALFTGIIHCINELEWHFFNKNTKRVGNWWEWEIGIPYQYALTLMYLRLINQDWFDKFKSNFKDIIEKFVRPFCKHSDLTYANQASICRNLFIAGVLLENETYINEALEYGVKAFEMKSASEVKRARWYQKLVIKHPWLPKSVSLFSGKEGLYEDGSFLQHTSIPYIGSYGVEVLEYASLLYNVLDGTSVKVPTDIENVLPTWINKAFIPSIYNGEMMLMYMGRSVSSTSTYDAGARVQKCLDSISRFVPVENSTEKFSLIQANNDCAIKQTNKYRFCVSMYSDRTARFECFIRATGNQNECGWYQNLGMTYLYVPNNHYNGYFLSTLYTELPGVTCSNDCMDNGKESVQPLFVYDKKHIDELLAGGVRYNDDYCSCMMQVSEDDVTAKKSWFMFGDDIICLGADINNLNNGWNFHTFIENRRCENSIEDCGDSSYYLEGVAKYTILLGKCNVDNGFEGYPYRKIYIEHENTDASYAYVISPLADRNYNPFDERVHILRNSDKLQVVEYNKDGDYVYGINFWEDAKVMLKNGDILRAYSPCSVIVCYHNDENPEIVLSDVTQTKDKITIEFNDEKIVVNTKDLLGQTVMI